MLQKHGGVDALYLLSHRSRAGFNLKLSVKLRWSCASSGCVDQEKQLVSCA